jgi:hypothetical protein
MGDPQPEAKVELPPKDALTKIVKDFAYDIRRAIVETQPLLSDEDRAVWFIRAMINGLLIASDNEWYMKAPKEACAVGVDHVFIKFNDGEPDMQLCTSGVNMETQYILIPHKGRHALLRQCCRIPPPADVNPE